MTRLVCHLAIVLFTKLTFCTLIVHGLDFEPLGSHSTPSVGAPLLYGKFPPPFVFYHHFVKAGKPLLIKNVLNETGYEIFETWTDDYLRDRYGEETIEVEKRKKEQRGWPRSKLKFSKFLEVYQRMNLYMVNSASSFKQNEVMVPFTLQCGGFQNVLHDAYVWFSGGDTRSVLHYDMMDNINCLLDGRKTLVLIDKDHKEEVERDGFVHQGRYSLVDVDMVDKGAFPGVASAPWAKIHMLKGDCVYIPNKWYHHIRSDPGRNLAVNLWFSHLLWFNKTDCDDTNRTNPPLAPLRDFNLASTNENLRSEIFSPFEDLEEVNKEVFLQKSVCKTEDKEQIWKMVNSNGDKHLSWEEIYRVNMDKLVITVPECIKDVLDSTQVKSEFSSTGTDTRTSEDNQVNKNTPDSSKNKKSGRDKTSTKTDSRIKVESARDQPKTQRTVDSGRDQTNAERDSNMKVELGSDQTNTKTQRTAESGSDQTYMKSKTEQSWIGKNNPSQDEDVIDSKSGVNVESKMTEEDSDTKREDTTTSLPKVNKTAKTVHDEF